MKSERSFYKQLRKTCKDTLETYFGKDMEELPPPGAKVPDNTHAIEVHYSFDMAQQVEL